MIDEKELRTFLMTQPRGTKVLVRTEEDDVHEVRIPGTKGGGNWSNVAKSILAMSPKLVEVHAEDGSLIRAKRCDEASEAPVTRVADLPVMHSDPETARLTHFANLLFRAQEFATGIAFTKMTDLFGMVNERMVALESRLERAETNYRRELDRRLDDAFDRADALTEEAERVAKEGAPGDPITAFAQAVMAGQQEQAATPARPNGKGHP